MSDQLKKTAISLTTSLAEVGLDSILNDGILKDVPVLGTCIGIINASKDIQNIIFSKKLRRFIESLNQIPKSEVDLFKDVIAKRSDDIEDVANRILMVINASIDSRKSEVVANIFLGYLHGELSTDELKRALELTNTIYVEDLLLVLSEGFIDGHMSSSKLNMLGLGHLANTPLFWKNPIRHDHDPVGRKVIYSSGRISQKVDYYEGYNLTVLSEKMCRAYRFGLELRNR